MRQSTSKYFPTTVNGLLKVRRIERTCDHARGNLSHARFASFFFFFFSFSSAVFLYLGIQFQKPDVKLKYPD